MSSLLHHFAPFSPVLHYFLRQNDERINGTLWKRIALDDGMGIAVERQIPFPHLDSILIERDHIVEKHRTRTQIWVKNKDRTNFGVKFEVAIDAHASYVGYTDTRSDLANVWRTFEVRRGFGERYGPIQTEDADLSSLFQLDGIPDSSNFSADNIFEYVKSVHTDAYIINRYSYHTERDRILFVYILSKDYQANDSAIPVSIL